MIGVDIVEIEQNRLSPSFVSYILTAEEQEEYNALPAEKQKKEYLAGRFASKEAIFKATQDINYLDYAILHGPNGAPYVLNHPEIQISISHSRTIAIAFIEVI